MKLTDLTMIYIVILLPIVITVMVNTSFVVTAQKHELYTKTVIDSSVRDAVDSMKKVENKDSEIDYGYSNDIIGKISVDPKIAVNTFFNSMALNLGAVKDDYTADYLRAYVPVIAVMDYDGLYTYSVDSTDGTNLTHSVKPKTYFSFMYCIVQVIDKIEQEVVEPSEQISFPTLRWVDKETGDSYIVIRDNTAGTPRYYAVVPYEVALRNNLSIYANLVYNIKYTQDMYVYLDVYQRTDAGMIPLKKAVEDIQANLNLEKYNTGFYLDDYENYTWLAGEPYHLYQLDR